MMESIQSAPKSPRFEHGALCWFYLDTFRLSLTLQLTDDTGSPITVQPNDTVLVSFFSAGGKKVTDFSFGGGSETPIEDGGTVTLVFDDEVSALFLPGKYTYDVVYKAAYRQTIAHKSPVVVV